MRIDNALPAFYNVFPQNAAVPSVQPTGAPSGAVPPVSDGSRRELPGIVVDISPQSWAAYQRGGGAVGAGGQSAPLNGTTGTADKAGGAGAIKTMEELQCVTCSNRKYQDVSNDSSVSFQAPTRISPGQAAGAVRAHEQEHVSNEQTRAERDGRRIVSQTVTLSSAICPECKRPYISGGVTRTTTASDNRGSEAPDTAAPAEGAPENA